MTDDTVNQPEARGEDDLPSDAEIQTVLDSWRFDFWKRAAIWRRVQEIGAELGIPGPWHG